MSGLIFISYREADAKGWAIFLRDALVERFGDEAVFFDKDGLHAGTWGSQLASAVANSRAVLVVIGKQWLTVADEHGRSRLQDPGDVHRREIATALLQPHTTVVPVLVGGSSVPAAGDLPEDLRRLFKQQARMLSDLAEHREHDLRMLVADLASATGLRARPLPSDFSWGAAARLAGRAVLVSLVTTVFVVVISEAFWGIHVTRAEAAVIAVSFGGAAVLFWRRKRKALFHVPKNNVTRV